MTIKIRIPKNLQKKTDGNALAVVQGSTVRECMDMLIRRYPDLRGEILDDRGMILLRWMIHLNDQSIRTADASSHPVKEGDIIDLLPMVSGG